MGCATGAAQAAIDTFGAGCSSYGGLSAAAELPMVPSGPDSSHPTIIEGQDEPNGCRPNLMPELYAIGGPYRIIDFHGYGASSWSDTANLGTSHVKIACLNIDDHAQCTYSSDLTGGPTKCGTINPIDSAWGKQGIQGYYVTDADFDNLWIHGMGGTGMYTGPTNGWTMTNSVISGNSAGNIDFTGPGPTNEGTISLSNSIISLSGILEPYPSSVSLTSGVAFGTQIGTVAANGMSTFPYDVPNSSSLDAWSDGTDGIGFGHTGGTFIANKVWVYANTQDGLDTLYFDQQSALVEESQIYSWGNSGNQLKGSGTFYLWNNIAVGNCDYLSTELGANYHGPTCRAGGSPMVLVSTKGTQSYVAFNTVSGPPLANSNSPVNIACRSIAEGAWADCSTSDSPLANITFKNNIIYQSYSVTPYYWDGTGTVGTCTHPYCAPTVVDDHNDYWNTPTSNCPWVTYVTSGAITSTNYLCQTDPLLVNGTISSFNANLASSSPVIGAGTAYMGITTDYNGVTRPSPPSMGALEYGSGPSGSYTTIQGTGSIQGTAVIQ